MGNCGLRCRRFKNRVGNIRRRKIVLLLVGLDNAGKTTAARGLAGEDQDGIVPTVGFSALNLSHQGYAVVIYDLGGGPQIRGIWPEYYVDAHGVIFIVDSSDVARLDESRRILEELLAHEKLSGKPVLLLANKQDKPGALDEIDLVEKLNVEGIVNKHRCPTLVETCTALSDPSKKSKDRLDPGIRNGYRWLLSMIIKDFAKFDARVERDTLTAREKLNREKEEKRQRLMEEKKMREDSEVSRIIPLRDESMEVQSINGDEETGDDNVKPNAEIQKTDSSVEDIRNINTDSKSRFIDLDGDEISLITNGSNDSGLHTLGNGSCNQSANKQSSKDTIEEEPVEEIIIERRVNGYIESMAPREVPVFKEYVSDVRCDPAPKKSLLKKSNRTAPAPLGSLLTDVVIDRRRLPPLASPPPLQMFEIAPMKRPLPARSISMSDDFKGSTKTMTSTIEEYEPAAQKKRSGSIDHVGMGDSNAV